MRCGPRERYHSSRIAHGGNMLRAALSAALRGEMVCRDAACQAAGRVSTRIGARRSRRGPAWPLWILPPTRMTTGPWMTRLSRMSDRDCTMALLSTSEPETKNPGELPGSAMVTDAMPLRGSAPVSRSRCGREGNALVTRHSDASVSDAILLHVVLLPALVAAFTIHRGCANRVDRTCSWRQAHDSPAYV